MTKADEEKAREMQNARQWDEMQRIGVPYSASASVQGMIDRAAAQARAEAYADAARVVADVHIPPNADLPLAPWQCYSMGIDACVAAFEARAKEVGNG